jgi:hypothetical protein
MGVRMSVSIAGHGLSTFSNTADNFDQETLEYNHDTLRWNIEILLLINC